MRTTDVVVKDVRFETEGFRYRTPIKFGGVSLDRVTLLHATVTVESLGGQRATGIGSMPMGNVWAFPSRELSYDQTLGAMLSVAQRVASCYSKANIVGHPMEITWQLEKELLRLGPDVTREWKLADSIPPLATLVAASPFDAALHDAYGKLHRLNVYHAYGKNFLENDLQRFLGPAFRGVRIDSYLTPEPVDSLPLYHLVGALDPLARSDVAEPVGDGLPETLEEWIAWNGLTHLKIKLNGDDLDWDVHRVLSVEAAADAAQRRRGVNEWHYSLDFNEKCRNEDYLLEFLAKLKAGSPPAFERIAYIEQPTARDLQANRHNVMHQASRQIPIVIDESLLDLESLLLARDMGYNGAALKACKGQTQSILLAGAAGHLKMFLCVQDLTCPGASLIQSAGLAAHVRGVTAIEANARQYCPQSNATWSPRFPGIFEIRDGVMKTGQLTGWGLGAG